MARGDQRPQQPGVLGVRGQDLVARADVEPGEDRPEPEARPAGDRHVVALAVQQPRVAVAELVLQLVPAHEVLIHAPLLELRVELDVGLLDGGTGERAIRARVEVGDVLEYREFVTEGHSGR